VNEAGARVVAHTSAAESKRGIAKSECVYPGDADIDGVRLHVQAVLGDAGRARAKEFVAPGTAIAADNIDFSVGMADGSGEIREDVKDVRIVMLDFASAMVAKEMIELRFGFRKKEIAPTIDDINVLSSVGVIETEVVF
jgi:hypothetical protein